MRSWRGPGTGWRESRHWRPAPTPPTPWGGGGCKGSREEQGCEVTCKKNEKERRRKRRDGGGRGDEEGGGGDRCQGHRMGGVRALSSQDGGVKINRNIGHDARHLQRLYQHHRVRNTCTVMSPPRSHTPCHGSHSWEPFDQTTHRPVHLSRGRSWQ